MHTFARAAGAFVAAVALSVVAAPANAATNSTVVNATSIAQSDSVLSGLPLGTEISARFKPWKCDERKYFRKHTWRCIQFFDDYYEGRGDGRWDGRGDGDGRRGGDRDGRGGGDRDGRGGGDRDGRGGGDHDHDLRTF